MKKEIRIFFTAIMFLTRIRVPPSTDHSPVYLREAPRYFPVVGWIVGLISALFYLVGTRFVSADVGVVAVMVAGILVTGAFHEDGFADVCDGFGGGWTREKILEIMKDSRIGAYGAIGLICILLSKFVLLKELPSFTPVLDPTGPHAALAASGFSHSFSGGFSHWLSHLLSGWFSGGFDEQFAGRFSGAPWSVFYNSRYALLAIVCAHTLSRLMPVLVMQTCIYAGIADRSKSGAMTGQRLSVGGLVAAVVFALVPFAFLSWHYLLVIIPVLYATFELDRYFKRWIGGYTGDCLGAIQQVSEIIILLGFVLIYRYF